MNEAITNELFGMLVRSLESAAVLWYIILCAIQAQSEAVRKAALSGFVA